MDDESRSKPGQVSAKEAHAERVARAMRENLKKRKEQARAKPKPAPDDRRG